MAVQEYRAAQCRQSGGKKARCKSSVPGERSVTAAMTEEDSRPDR